MSIYRIKPEKIQDASRVLWSQQGNTCGLDARGLRQAFFIESMDELGRVIWLSVWDSLGDARDYLSSSHNAAVAASLAPYLQTAPEWYQYTVLAPCVRAE